MGATAGTVAPQAATAARRRKRPADSGQFRGRSTLLRDAPLRLLASVLRAVHVAMSRHVASVGPSGSRDPHFQLRRRTKIIDRNKPRIEYPRRPFPQSAPIAGAMRRATKALLFASINAQAEWATAPDTCRLTFGPHRAALGSTLETFIRLVGSMSELRFRRATILPAARDRAAPVEAEHMERVLADVDAHRRNFKFYLLDARRCDPLGRPARHHRSKEQRTSIIRLRAET
jgi:hypothetical protein